MTFKRFEEIVKTKYPKARVWKHGDFIGNKINVAIIFTGEHGTVYQYNGTYINVLRKLGINAVYQLDIDSTKKELEECKSKHGKPMKFFPDATYDMSVQIKMYEDWLEEVKDYIVL